MNKVSTLYIILFFFATLSFAETNVYDQEWLEMQLDIAHHTRNADPQIHIYTNILAHVSSNTLVTTTYDGANTLFVIWSGLSWAYLAKADTNYLHRGLDYGLRARKSGYETGVPASNPERFADRIHVLSLYYEHEMFSDAEQREFYYDEAWENWPYFNEPMQNLWRRKRALVYYEPSKAIPISLEVVNNAPFCNTLFYRNCGWHYTLLEKYRDAFAIWHRGLIDGEPHFWRSPTPERFIQHIEHATLEELEETKRLYRVNAAKYPATMDTIEDVTGWLRWAEHPHLQFEMQLRTAEKDGNIHLVTNMLEIAVRQYKRPQYAEKLGDTNTLIKLYCDRMKEETWWWAMPEYSLLPKVQTLIETGNLNYETIEYYKRTLLILENKHSRFSQIIKEYRKKI